MPVAHSPLPVVAACTGHALAAGAPVLLAADLRLGASQDAARVGFLDEVAPAGELAARAKATIVVRG